MPITSSALKALRRDERRTEVNKKIRSQYKQALKIARERKTADSVASAYTAIDRAAKKHVVHANTAARLKSRLVALVQRSGGSVFGKVKKSTAKKIGWVNFI